MLLNDWRDLDETEADSIEADNSGWCIQEKKDGVRALLHINKDGIRITGRTVSEVNFRLSEFQDNLPHLAGGVEDLAGTILDGELVSPADVVDTGDTITANALQAATAILAANPEKAMTIQNEHAAELEYHAFDILRYKGQDVTARPLRERLAILAEALSQVSNKYIEMVPTDTTDKLIVHEQLIASDVEGSVWKKLDQPYQPGKRAKHWIKRKRGIEVEAFVSGFKPGNPGRGNRSLVGAVEFSVQDDAQGSRPIAWVSNWADEDRQRLTTQLDGSPALNPTFLNRKALIRGQDIAAKSQRIRHATFVQWC